MKGPWGGEAEGTHGAEMMPAALRLIQRLPVASVVVPVQALGELFNVLVLKAKRPATNARTAILGWRDAYAVIDTSSAVMLDAADLATDHTLRIWDAVVLSASAEAGCRLLLLKDLQEGFTWRGVTVTNPFAATPHLLLDALLGSGEHDVFALIASDVLYFKVDDETRPAYLARGMQRFRPYGPDGEEMGYYEVPLAVIEDADALRAWVSDAIAVARRAGRTLRRRAGRGHPLLVLRASEGV